MRCVSATRWFEGEGRLPRGIHCLASVKGNHVAGRALIYQPIVDTTDQYPNVLAAKVFGAPAGRSEIKL